MSQVLDNWIEGLVRARKTSQRVMPPLDLPSKVEDAYRIQAGVAANVGRIGGFKTARKTGADPIIAPIFAADIVPSGAQVAVPDMLGIELEVGFQIIEDCPLDMPRLSSSELGSLLRPVVVIELVDTRLTGPDADNDIVKLADNQINAGLVVGPSFADWSGCDFGTVEAKMQAGDDIILDGTAMVPGGSAIETFKVFAHQIGDHCGGLKRGQIVITGSLHPLVYYPSGTLVQGWIRGIGKLAVTLGA